MTIVITIFFFETVTAAILRGPSNVAVVVGTNMTMTCLPNQDTNTVDWYHTPVRSKDSTSAMFRINQGTTLFKNFTEFSIGGKIPGESLNLDTTQLKHAGFYQCTSSGQKATAQLVVLASEPNCNFSSQVIKDDETRVKLSCSVQFNGYWNPVVEWSQMMDGNTKSRIIPVNEYAMEHLEKELTSSLNFIINSTVHGFRYSCKIYFRNSSASQASKTASNIPTYESIWTSPDTEMFHGPKNVTVFPLKHVFHPGDVLTCSAEPTRGSEFEWTEIETGDVFKGPSIIINASMVREEPYSFSCTAFNKLTRAYMTSSLVTLIVTRYSGKYESVVTQPTGPEYAENSADNRQPNTVLFITAAAASTATSIIFAGCLLVFRVKRKRKRLFDLQKEYENQNTVTPPTSVAEDTLTVHAIVTPHKSIELRPISLIGAGTLSDSYEEIESKSDGTSSSCYNVGNVSGEHRLSRNDEVLGSNQRNSSSSADSKQTSKSTKYEDLLERDPALPSVYLRIMKSHKEQDTQTSNSPTSSEDISKSQTIYVNISEANVNE